MQPLKEELTEVALLRVTAYNDRMNTSVRTQQVIVTNFADNDLQSSDWMAADPEWRVMVSLNSACKMYRILPSNRMQYETSETIMLSTAQKALEMGLSVWVNLFWSQGYSHPQSMYDRLYKLISQFEVEVRTYSRGNVPQYIKPSPRGKAYVPNPTLPKAVWVDVDGTLAKMSNRSPFDWSRVHEDTPHTHVFDVVKALQANGYKIVVLSGRDEICLESTKNWIEAQGVHVDAIHMRPQGDSHTPDDILKHDLFWKYVANKFDVRLALDDRDKVVSFTRDVLKIPVFQVAPGNF